MTKMYIPDEVVLGLIDDDVALSKKLGFLTYRNDKGKLTSEKKFHEWIDKSQGISKFENKPRSGFILNRHINHVYYNFGKESIRFRVFCPEGENGFEFEITSLNLSYILSVSDISKREIVEECVFAWNERELMLLPVNSEHYKEAKKNTIRRNTFEEKQEELKNGHVFKPGDVIQSKSGNLSLYVGRKSFIYYDDIKKELLELNPKSIYFENGRFLYKKAKKEVDVCFPMNFKGKSNFLNKLSSKPVNLANYLPVEKGFSWKAQNCQQTKEEMIDFFNKSSFDFNNGIVKYLAVNPDLDEYIWDFTDFMSEKTYSLYNSNHFINAFNPKKVNGCKSFVVRMLNKNSGLILLNGKPLEKTGCFDFKVTINGVSESFVGSVDELLKEYPCIAEAKDYALKEFNSYGEVLTEMPIYTEFK